jgi:hypothetical protein
VPLPSSADFNRLKRTIMDTLNRSVDTEEQLKMLLGVVTDQQQAIDHLKREVERLFAIVYNKGGHVSRVCSM